MSFVRAGVRGGVNGAVIVTFYDNELPREVVVKNPEFARRFYAQLRKEEEIQTALRASTQVALEDFQIAADEALAGYQAQVDVIVKAREDAIAAATANRDAAMAPLLGTKQSIEKEAFELAEKQLVAEARAGS